MAIALFHFDGMAIALFQFDGMAIALFQFDGMYGYSTIPGNGHDRP